MTIGYNCLEATVALVAGAVAGSIALVGFGLDSVIEVTSGVALLWRLRADADHAARERAERVSLKVVGICFLALSAYVAFEAAESLLLLEAPRHSLPGILLAIASMVVMPVLSRAKRRVAGRIGSAALAADSRQTELCAWLSVILLAGLTLNAVARLVVGRSRRGPGHDADHRPGGCQRVAGQGLLRELPLTPTSRRTR